VVTHYKELAKYNIRKLTEVSDEGVEKGETAKKLIKGTKKLVQAGALPLDTKVEDNNVGNGN
jgi:hypothetical protein